MLFVISKRLIHLAQVNVRKYNPSLCSNLVFLLIAFISFVILFVFKLRSTPSPLKNGRLGSGRLLKKKIYIPNILIASKITISNDHDSPKNQHKQAQFPLPIQFYGSSPKRVIGCYPLVCVGCHRAFRYSNLCCHYSPLF